MNSEARIILADDHQLVKDGLRLLLSVNTQWTICAEAGSGPELLAVLTSTPCDLIITDLHMSGMRGIDLIKELKSAYPQIPVLVLTMHDEEEIIQEILLAEAEGYLLKNAGKEEVTSAVQDLLNGNTHYAPEVMQQVLRDYRQVRKQEVALKPLSPREMEILRLILAEQNSKEIAAQLFISKQTVDTHRANIMQKTGSRTLVGLIKYAIRNGLDTPASL